MDLLRNLDLDVLLDTMPNAIFIKDEHLRFIFINKAYEHMFNVNREDVLGKRVLDIEFLPMEDKEFYQEEDASLLKNGETKHHIFNYLCKGDKLYTCMYWSSGFTQANGKSGIVGVLVDINQQSDMIQTLRNKLRITNLEKREATKRSKIDFLTNLYARRAFDEALQQFVISEEGVFSCIMLDIDHFKQVNDTFGHLVGDSVLREVASSLKKYSRKPDNAYRYGGEEFALLLSGTDLGKAVVAAERIRCLISEEVRLPDGRQVTVSAGCSEYLPGESGASLVRRADSALYAAKNSGRNRVCSSVALE